MDVLGEDDMPENPVVSVEYCGRGFVTGCF
jgi:hypothetical protein